MQWPRFAGTIGMSLVLTASLALPRLAPGQAEKSRDRREPSAPKAAGPARADKNIQAIDDDYDRQLLQLDRSRLERLGLLAAKQQPDEAAATYERLFRLAIAGNLFVDAEAAANNVIKHGTPSRSTNALAHFIKIIAEADRGAYEQSLQSLRQAVAESVRQRQAKELRAVLATDDLVGICEAYYQRLVEGNQFAIARDAFRLVLENAQRPAVKDFLASRLKRIELVGKPAPPIAGTDLDGKTFNLGDSRGKVVLIVFWASWCLPNAAQIARFEEVYDTYHKRGLQVVGINLDAEQDGGQKLETVLPNIHRFLLDHNIPWPTLMNGPGDRDYARAYGITDIPANALIGRNGTVVQVDLSRRNLESVIVKTLGD
jgi:thiol-disulfide isomerase/thioredoxin